MKKLPIGIQSFETIREQGYLYVDKTRYIHHLITQGMFYFLSRPRRFGKSLLVSTIKCLFQGRKELFEGLWVSEHTSYEWKSHPVILIDFNEINHDTPESLNAELCNCLSSIAESCQIRLPTSYYTSQFKELILKLYQKTGMPVVILIDEYDKPIIDHLGKGDKGLEIAKANRDILKSFFGVLKGGTVSPVIRFVFLTGVSRFSRVSIFSELNNLQDITMNEHYADMLGYTQEELESYFKDYIVQFAEKIRCSEDKVLAALARYYNGYRFSKKNIKMYNPFSILNAFSENEFKNYWFETGTPSFLINLLIQEQYEIPEIEHIQIDQDITTFNIEDLNSEILLLQTGYVTIRDIQEGSYILDYPNQEVKQSFLKHLLTSMTQGASNRNRSHILQLSKYLQKENFKAFFDTISAIFASIPYTLNTKRDEAYFHTIFYLMVSASGAEADSEVLTAKGRIDMVVKFSDKIFVIEFKCNQSADAAIAQIRDKGYAEKYLQIGKRVFLIGVNFNTEIRNVKEWKWTNG